jgi:hypothetical protein
MQAIATIGLDVAKSVFQVHGIDSEGRVTVRRQLKRRYVLAFLPITVCPVTRRISRLTKHTDIPITPTFTSDVSYVPRLSRALRASARNELEHKSVKAGRTSIRRAKRPAKPNAG